MLAVNILKLAELYEEGRKGGILLVCGRHGGSVVRSQMETVAIAPGKVQKRPTSNTDDLWQQRGMRWPSGDEEGQEKRRSRDEALEEVVKPMPSCSVCLQGNTATLVGLSALTDTTNIMQELRLSGG